MTDIQAELRLKGLVVLDDVIVQYGGEWPLLRPGDTYIGKHGDEDPEVLTVRRVEVQRRQSGLTSGKVFPKERKKRLYDLHEVVKIIVMKNPNPPKKAEEKQDVGGLRDENNPADSGKSREHDGQRSQPAPRPNHGRPRDAGRVDYTKPSGAQPVQPKRDPKRLP